MVTAKIELLLNMVGLWCFVVYCVQLPVCWIFCLPWLFQSFCLSQSIPVMDFQYWSCKSWVSVLVLFMDIKVLVLVLVLKLLSLGLGLGLETSESWSWSWSWTSESWSWSWNLRVLVLVLVLEKQVLNPSLPISLPQSVVICASFKHAILTSTEHLPKKARVLVLVNKLRISHCMC